MSKFNKPKWVPKNASSEFASNVMPGIDPPQHTPGKIHPVRKVLTVDQHVTGVIAGNRTILARTITLIESNSIAHQHKAQEVLTRLLPHAGKSVRVGITGVPGVGKSTFIDTLGCHLTEQGKKVAVLAVDPSSSITRGSILGDKTRMEKLSRDENCFIRPSPAAGTLGGVARKSRETMLVCEAAGFDVLLIETVGVGQNEISVRSMVDFFLLLMIAGAGDELQGIKRGVMELADAVTVNKTDGDNINRAKAARSEYERALHYLPAATHGWQTMAHTCSSMTGEGIQAIWETIEQFAEQTTQSGIFTQRRKDQNLRWLKDMVDEHLQQRFLHHPAIKKAMPHIEQSVEKGELSVTLAAEKLVRLFDV